MVNRVASASIKPYATGRIDQIPVEAKEPEEYYNSVRDQYLLLSNQFQDVQAKLADINKQLRVTLPFPEFDRLNKEKQRLGDIHRKLQQECSDMRSLVCAAGRDAWAATFYAVARRCLEPEIFRKIDREVKDLLGRNIQEIKIGEAQWSQTKRNSTQAREHRKRRGRAFRDNRPEGGHRLAWDGEKSAPQNRRGAGAKKYC
jgi:hypothetical protein